MMRTFITQLCGPINMPALLIQQAVARAAKQVNILPMSLFHFDARQEPPAELNSRLDGIISGINRGDTVILQTPIGMSNNYSKLLFAKLIDLQSVMDIKLIAIVENVFSQEDTDLLNLYRHCDALIAPVAPLVHQLQQLGINKEKLISLPCYDFEPNIDISDQPQKANCLTYLNLPSLPLPKELTKINCKTYVWQNQVLANEGQLAYQGRMDDDLLVNKINQNGGWGLIWPASEKQAQFLKEMVPFELSIYISAGLPIIARSDEAIALLIKEKQLGLVVNDLNEAIGKIKTIKTTEYQNLLKNVARLALLTRNNVTTKQALISAGFQANLPQVKENQK